MRITGFTKEFDSKIVRDTFLDGLGVSRQKAQTPDEVRQLIAYLESSDMVFGITLAIKVDDKYVPYMFRSDGEWIWPGHLSALVRSRNIDLDMDFLEHMRSRNYQVGKLSSTVRHKVEKFIIDNNMFR